MSGFCSKLKHKFRCLFSVLGRKNCTNSGLFCVCKLSARLKLRGKFLFFFLKISKHGNFLSLKLVTRATYKILRKFARHVWNYCEVLLMSRFYGKQLDPHWLHSNAIAVHWITLQEKRYFLTVEYIADSSDHHKSWQRSRSMPLLESNAAIHKFRTRK